jgi:hypothetical protein
MVHILPNIALCTLYEPFVDWDSAIDRYLPSIQRAYEGVVGMLHLIPSNLDVSLIMTSLLAL